MNFVCVLNQVLSALIWAEDREQSRLKQKKPYTF